MIRSLILRAIYVWKHFNFLARSHAVILYVHVKIKNHHNIFLTHLMGPIFVEDATKVESKIILESQDSGSDVTKALQEGLVQARVEQLERNAVNFL